MTRRGEHWTTEDLELLRDEELDATRRDELSEDLRRDPALRERLATVYRVDDALRVALTEPDSTAHRWLGGTLSRSRFILAAASLLLAVTAVAWYAVLRPSSHSRNLADGVGKEQRQSAEAVEYEPIRVVFSLPVQPTRQDARSTQTVMADRHEQPARPARGGFLARLNDALRTEQIQEALSLLDGASKNERGLAYRYIGELLRSAQLAEELLDRLTPQEQVTVCGEWAREPGLRPVVFTRLRRLSQDPGLSEDVQVLVTKLAREPTLRSWLLGYQLVGRDSAGKLTPS
jgi:hypothetical protein